VSSDTDGMLPTSGGDGESPARLSVAAYNLHCGVDGWGRPYNVGAVLVALDADVLVLSEAWMPDRGSVPLDELAGPLGYRIFSQPLASGRLAGPHPEATDRWMHRWRWWGAGHALYLDSERRLARAQRASERYAAAEPGSWGMAVLCRVPTAGHQVIDLGRLPQDRARRAAVVVELPADGQRGACTVVGTHMSHLTFGSPAQFRTLAGALDERVGEGPAVLAGDMNLWGPPVTLLLPGWRRAVRGRTWPAWRPHSQIDHLLVRGAVAVEQGQVLPAAGSDHRPVRAELRIGHPAEDSTAGPPGPGRAGSAVAADG
jgi:endonuclease/exonuclease/phosphatase family metal-dependent hydrolase